MLSDSSMPKSPVKVAQKTTQQADDQESVSKRPKKVNSEVRKQQNRIASRNYREKKKLLQQHRLDKKNSSSSNDSSQTPGQIMLTPQDLASSHRRNLSLSPVPSDYSYNSFTSHGSYASSIIESTTVEPLDAFSTQSPPCYNTSPPLPNTQLALCSFQPAWPSPPITAYDTPMPPSDDSSASAMWQIPTWPASTIDFNAPIILHEDEDLQPFDASQIVAVQPEYQHLPTPPPANCLSFHEPQVMNCDMWCDEQAVYQSHVGQQMYRPPFGYVVYP